MSAETQLHALRIETTAYYAVRAPEEGVPLRANLLALHGWGQTSDRFLRNFAPLARRGVRVVAPQGPHAFYLDGEHRKVGFNWLTRFERAQAIADVNGFLSRVLDALPDSAAPVYVLGFSQGSAMAYRFALHAGGRIAGVISCGADLPPDVADRLDEFPRIPVVVARGVDDPLVPESVAAHAHETLAAHGLDAARWDHAGAHDLPEALVTRLGDWLLTRTG